MQNHPHPILDATAMVGILIGFGMLLPSFLVPELRMLAAPAFAILVPSVLFGMR